MSNEITFDNSDTSISVTDNKRSPTSYRTKATSGANSDVTIPDKIATPTYKPYQYAVTLFEGSNAYLQPNIDTSNLKFQDGKLFFEDPTGIMRKVSEIELITNFKTQEPVTELTGLPFLKVYYSIILKYYMESIKKNQPINEMVKLYMPDLAESLGYRRSKLNQDTIDSIIGRMLSFHNTIGVMRVNRNDKVYKNYYPLFLVIKYEGDTNTITLFSPYIYKIIENIHKEAIKMNHKTHLPQLDEKGNLIALPAHSYLIKSSIASEKNLAAVENIFIIVPIIEQAGDHIANIKASTIIERNPIFKYQIEQSDPQHKSQIIQRVFKRTWQLLREQTNIIETYKNIQLPDPNNPADIPTQKKLDMVFKFPHEGKINGK